MNEKSNPFLNQPTPSRLPHLQGESQEASWGPRRGHLQLRAAPLHPHVVGEGGGEEPPRRLPVRQVQERHQPGGGDRRPRPGAGRPGQPRAGPHDRRRGPPAAHRHAARRGRRGGRRGPRFGPGE